MSSESADPSRRTSSCVAPAWVSTIVAASSERASAYPGAHGEHAGPPSSWVWLHRAASSAQGGGAGCSSLSASCGTCLCHREKVRRRDTEPAGFERSGSSGATTNSVAASLAAPRSPPPTVSGVAGEGPHSVDREPEMGGALPSRPQAATAAAPAASSPSSVSGGRWCGTCVRKCRRLPNSGSWLLSAAPRSPPSATATGGMVLELRSTRRSAPRFPLLAPHS